MSLVYLASPYSHKKDHVRLSRYYAARRAAAIMQLQGRNVFSPILHSHPIEELFRLEGLQPPDPHEFWMRQDLPILERCDVLSVLTLIGFSESKGVQAEIDHVKKINQKREKPDRISIEFVNPSVLEESLKKTKKAT
jgi:hypothetical protein